jgi:hypothetical protein
LKNCLVFGFARSGTSTIAGVLNNSGYFSGENLYPPNETNPKGFFENDFINSINEEILKKYENFHKHLELATYSNLDSPYKPSYGQRWLMHIEPYEDVLHDDNIITEKIKNAINHPIFAYKDPRFCYTLPIWNQFLNEETHFIVIFRSPANSILSVLEELKRSSYLKNFIINAELIENLWLNSYSHVIRNMNTIGIQKFTFLQYESLLSDENVLKILSERLNTKLTSNFISPELNRVRSDLKLQPNTIEMFERLKNLSI